MVVLVATSALPADASPQGAGGPKSVASCLFIELSELWRVIYPALPAQSWKGFDQREPL